MRENLIHYCVAHGRQGERHRRAYQFCSVLEGNLFASILVSDHAVTLTPWLVGQISVKEVQIISEGDELSHLSVTSLLMVTPLFALIGLY
jgi:hypothetical protein